MMNLSRTVSDIRVGNATVYGGLAVFPLSHTHNEMRDYLTLREAFEKRGVEISEVSEGGSVPELRFRNLLDTDIFAADGETLRGAKQNRVLNSSIYVKAHQEVTIPVCCVVQGRWSYRNRNFEASEYGEFVTSRAAKVASVGASLRSGAMSRPSNQAEVWDQIAKKRRVFRANAPTSSMEDVYKARKPRLDEYLEHIRPWPGQAGLAVAIDGETVGVELFESPEVFSQYFDRLIRAYAAEVVGSQAVATVVPDRYSVRHLLRRISRADIDVYDAVGNGQELRFSQSQLNGAALVVDDRLLHMVMLRRKSDRRSWGTTRRV